MKILLLSLIVSCLMACGATLPSKPITQAPANDVSLPEVYQGHQRFLQVPVRWGGRILTSIEAEDERGRYVELQVLEHPLDEQGRPLATTSSSGRFIAQVRSSFELSRYRRGRMITISGVLSGIEALPLTKDTEQDIAVVEAHHHHLWKGYYAQRSHTWGNGEYQDNDYRWWPHTYIYYRHGLKYRRGRSGIGIIFHPKLIRKIHSH